MKLLKDTWSWIKEWNDWGMKDWIKAGIICAVVLFIVYKMTSGGSPAVSMPLRGHTKGTQWEYQ